TDITDVVDGFVPLAREVTSIPYDPAMVDGALSYGALRPATQRAWLAAGAAVARGLYHQTTGSVMKLLRFGMPGGIAIFALMLVAVMVSVVGFGAIMFSVTAADSTDEETQAQAVSSRCTPGASPDNAPDEYQDAISWAAEES